jgi:tripartite-type tricarboxylate transporter receptor subunit TctC
VGLEVMNRTGYYGIYGPRGLPREVVDKVNAAVTKTLEDPAVRKRIEDIGAFVVAGTPEQFGEQIKAELAVFRRVVVQRKLSLD